MYTGNAKGGPRNGVKLTASINWDGRVKDSKFRCKPASRIGGRPRTEREPGYYHPGRYVFNPYECTWDWRADH